MATEKNRLLNTAIAAMLLAAALVLPFLTGQIPQIGKMLCPMHLPVMLCGFICGPVYGGAIGFVAPFLRFALFGMPAIMPDATVMCFELAAYGIVCGALYRALPKSRLNTYIALLCAMLAGRLLWGVARAVLMGLGKAPFGIGLFITGGFVTALPGIILQLILVPVLVTLIEKALVARRR